jgi:ubiquitin C-terminal hydrolase
MHQGKEVGISMSKMGGEGDSNWDIVSTMLYSSAGSSTQEQHSIEEDERNLSGISKSNGSSNAPKPIPNSQPQHRPLPHSITSSPLTQRHLNAASGIKPKRQTESFSKDARKLGDIMEQHRLDKSSAQQPKTSVDLGRPSHGLTGAQSRDRISIPLHSSSSSSHHHGLSAAQPPTQYQRQSGQLMISHEAKESPGKSSTLSSTSTSHTSFAPFKGNNINSPLSTSQHQHLGLHTTTSSSNSNSGSSTEYTGIRNTGNTCYINAVLQGLMSLGSFVSDLGREQLTELTKEIDLRSFYRAFLAIADQTLETGRKTALDPSRVKLAVARHSERFRDNEQQDAHEFMISCLSQLEVDLMPFLNEARKRQQKEAIEAANIANSSSKRASGNGKRKKKSRSSSSSTSRMIIDDGDDDDNDEQHNHDDGEGSNSEGELGPGVEDGIPFSERITMLDPSKRNFAGVLKSTLTCDQCEDQSFNYESIRCITLDVFETTEQMVDHVVSNMRGPSNLPLENEESYKSDLFQKFSSPPTIDQLLSIYFSPEKIERRCEKCECKVSTMRREIAQLPRVLVIHLKRFSYNFERRQYAKLQYPIAVSKSLDLKQFCSSGAACAGPIPFTSDGSGTIQRSRSRIQSLPQEEQALKDLLKNDRAAKKRKRTTFPTPSAFDSDDDLLLTGPSVSRPKPPAKRVESTSEISDSNTSISFLGNNRKPSNAGASQTRASRYDESGAAYQNLIEAAFGGSSSSGGNTLSAPPSTGLHLELSDEDDEAIFNEPPLKKAISPADFDPDGSAEFQMDFQVPQQPQKPQSGPITIFASDHHGSDAASEDGENNLSFGSPQSDLPSALDLPEPHDPFGYPSAYPDVGLGEDSDGQGEQKDHLDWFRELEGSGTKKEKKEKMKIQAWVPQAHPKGGLKGGHPGRKPKSAAAGMSIIDQYDNDQGDEFDEMDVDPELGSSKTKAQETISFADLAPAAQAMWEKACEYVLSDHDEERSLLDRLAAPIPLPVLRSVPRMPGAPAPSGPHHSSSVTGSNNAMASGSFETAASRANQNSQLRSATNSTTTAKTFGFDMAPKNHHSVPGMRPPMSQRSAQLTGNTYSRLSAPAANKTISLDDETEEEMLAKVMAESKADYEQQEMAKKVSEEEHLKRALEASEREASYRMPNDYDLDGLFDSGDEAELTARGYSRDEYEGDEVAPIHSDSDGPIPSIDPQRPPISFQYTLQSIVHHIGISANSGHYVADVRSSSSSSSSSDPKSSLQKKETQWKTFDDAKVTPTTEEQVFAKSASPYLLFYVCDSIATAKVS